MAFAQEGSPCTPDLTNFDLSVIWDRVGFPALLSQTRPINHVLVEIRMAPL
jgi:hypothetical protein